MASRVYVCLFVYVFMCICLYIYILVCCCVSSCVCLYICVYMNACMCVSMYISVCTCIHVCVCLCVCVCTWVHVCVYVSMCGNTDCVLHFYSTMVIFPTHFIISYFFPKKEKNNHVILVKSQCKVHYCYENFCINKTLPNITCPYFKKLCK